MTAITASMVRDLREKTGAGMMDCKTALQETGGEMEAAVDWLRAKGLSKAAKKAGRVAAEGLIAVVTETTEGALVEVNSETDFVARNAAFQEMVSAIASCALAAKGDVAALAAAPYPGKSMTVEEQLKETIGAIGENMTLRRTAYLEVESGVVASYIHNAAAPGLGKMGVIVALQSTGDADKLQAFGRQVAMHIAAANPIAVGAKDIDPGVIEREKAILIEQARESGKPEAVIDKMVQGRLKKFFEEVALLAQTFVIDGEQTVEQAVKVAEKDIGAPIEITGFHRYALGEGIERDKSDFAAEVAAAAGV